MLVSLISPVASAAGLPAPMPYAVEVDSTTAGRVEMHNVWSLQRRFLTGSVRFTSDEGGKVERIVLLVDGEELQARRGLWGRPLAPSQARFATLIFPVDKATPDRFSTATLRVEGSREGQPWTIEAGLVDRDLPDDSHAAPALRRWYVTNSSHLGVMGGDLAGYWSFGTGVVSGPIAATVRASLLYTLDCTAPPTEPCGDNRGGLGPGVGANVGVPLHASPIVDVVPYVSYEWSTGKAVAPESINPHRVGLGVALDTITRQSKTHRSGSRVRTSPMVQISQGSEGLGVTGFYINNEYWWMVGGNRRARTSKAQEPGGSRAGNE